MACFHISTIFALLLALILLTQNIAECRVTQETLNTAFGTSKGPKHSTQGTQWAVLVAGSNGYGNYRHQADICHAYQILKSGGLKDENIIVFMYDDIALNEENPRQGIIINNPNGSDVYKGVPKDYTGEAVNTRNLLAAILGNKAAIKGGSGKVVNSGPNDSIFIYYADHGSPGVLTMPTGEDLYANDLIKTLQKKHESGTYKSMVIYVEACEAGSMFDGLLPKDWNIYATTASNPDESSWATYCPGSDDPPPSDYETCLGDLYSVAWMEDSDAHSFQTETLGQQYEEVKERTLAGGDEGSHVMQYGSVDLDKDSLSIYMGSNPSRHWTKPPRKSHSSKGKGGKGSKSSIVEQHDADILYLQQKVRKAPEGSSKRAQAQKELDEALSHRKHVDSTIEAIGEAIFGADQGFEVLKTVRPSGQPIVDDWDCFKTLVGTYEEHCGRLSTYGKKHMRVFANMCNAGVHKPQLVEAASLVCGKK